MKRMFFRTCIALVVASGFGMAGPGEAQTMSVVSVASDDTLNMRTGLSTAATLSETTIVGHIPSGATDVLGTGRTLLFRGDRWHEVRWDGVTGWVHSRFVSLTSPLIPEPVFLCTLEPDKFRVEFGPQNGVLISDGGQIYELEPENFSPIVGSERHWAVSVRLTEAEGSYIAVIGYSRSCQIDSSGITYGYEISLVSRALATDGAASYGCCKVTN